MKQFQVTVIPCINKQNKLQGFRFEFGSTNLKGSEIHRSMSMGKIAEQIGFNRIVVEKAKAEGVIKLLDRTVNVTPNLATKIAAKVVKQAIKRTIDQGIGIGMEM